MEMNPWMAVHPFASLAEALASSFLIISNFKNGVQAVAAYFAVGSFLSIRLQTLREKSLGQFVVHLRRLTSTE